MLAWTLALAVVTGAHAALADQAKPVMLIVVAPGVDTGERAVQTIAAHLRLLGVEPQVVHEAVPSAAGHAGPAAAASQEDAAGPAILVRSRALASERDARGVLWVGAQKGELSIHLYERGRGRLYARSVAAEKGQTAAAIESLALIARSASAELLAGKVATMPLVGLRTAPPGAAPDPPASEATPAPSPSAIADASPATADVQLAPGPTPLDVAPIAARPPPEADAADPRSSGTGLGKLEVSAGYLGSSGTHSPVWRSAFSVEAGWRPTPNLTFALGYEIAPPDASGSGAMTLSFQRHPVFASTAYRFLFTDRFDLELGGRGTVNVVTQSGPMAMGKSTLVLGSMGPTIGAGIHILPFLRAGLLLGVDVELNPPASMDPRLTSERLQILGGLGLQLELGPRARRGASR